MSREKAIAQYLQRYAEPEVALLNDFPETARYQHVIVVPAHREEPDFLLRLQSLAETESETLVILVVNRPENQGDYHQDQQLWQRALESGLQSWQRKHLTLLNWKNRSGLLLVDRFSEGRPIPTRQGVGLARKIGCDLALELHTRANVRAHLIHSSDADAGLPADYFQQSAAQQNCSALVYAFHHVAGADPRINAATAVYEGSLHYYVDGLRWAGSPYAFHTIGSCMAVSMLHYAQCRGFPKRSGGEDFYLLNKLSKLAPVQQLQGEPIRLQARSSSRVPFGTGPAVNRILDLAAPDEFTTYAPDIFVELARLLDGFRSLWESRYDCETWLQQFSQVSQDACRELGMESLFQHLTKQAKTPSQCLEQTHHWFDAFRTLKFVRHLQSHKYPAVPLAMAQEQARRWWPSLEI